MSFTPKDWRDSPETTTPITAASLEDLETRVAAYADGGASGTLARYATAGTFTADQQFSGKVGIGVDPATSGTKKLSVLQTGVTDWLVSLGSDWNVLTAFHTAALSATDTNPHDLVDFFHKSTGDAIFASHQGGVMPAFSFTATTTNGSATLTAVSSFVGLYGPLVMTGTGIQASTSLVSTNAGAGTLVMSKPATASGTITVSVASPAGSAGGNAIFNALVPYYIDDVSTGRGGTIVNNRIGMKGLFIQTQSPNSGVYAIQIKHAGNAAALEITNQDPTTAQGAAGQGTGGPIVVTDYSTVSGISFSKGASPAAGEATLKLGTTVGSAIDVIRVNDSSGLGRFLSRADGQTVIGLNYPTGTPFAAKLQVDFNAAGIQRTLALTNGHTAATGDGTQIEFVVGGTQYATLQSVIETGAPTSSLRLRPRGSGGLTEVLRLDGTPGVGFFAVTPVARASAYTQTYATATKTHSNPTAAAIATTAATQATPWGYSTQAQADAVVAAINALIVDVANVKGVLNSVIDDHQAYGLFQ